MGKLVTKTYKIWETYKCASYCLILVNGGDCDHKKYIVFDLCFALSFCLQNFTTLLSVKTTEGRSLYVWISVLITGLHSKLFFFFLPCTSNHAHVIQGTDGLSWAFPIICAKNSKGLLPCQEFLKVFWNMGYCCPGLL